MVDALRDVVGFRMQLSKLQEYGKEISEMVARDAKSAMFLQLAKFREDYNKHSSTVVDLNPESKLMDWDSLHARNMQVFQDTTVADYISHKATMLLQAADQMMDDAMAENACGKYQNPETSWKVDLEASTPLKEVLEKSHQTIGKIKSLTLSAYIKSVKEAKDQAREWAERATVFGPSQEVTELLAKIEYMPAEYGLRALQYAESAVAYAIGHLSDKDSKMEPGSMRKILKDHVADACGGKKGYRQTDFQQALWAAANRLSEP